MRRFLYLALALLLVALLSAVAGPVRAAEIEWVYDKASERSASYRGLTLELEREAASFRRLERLAGAPASSQPIRVELVPEGSAVSDSTPGWVAGFAQGQLGRVVLFPERVPRYPNGSLQEVFRHELMHVYIARAAAGQAVPRWFNEGLSTVGATRWSFDDRSRLTWALLLRGRRELDEVDRMFRDGATAPGAYAISAAFVRDLLDRYGTESAAYLLAEVRRGASFETAFRSATGTTLARAQDRFWSSHSLFYRWIPVVSSSVTLWVIITVLFLIAAGRRRQRDARLREVWDAEEAARLQQEDGEWIH